MTTSTQVTPRSSFHLRLLAETLGQRRSSLEEEQIVETLGNSLVDLNPHQIDAALKAYRGPLQTGRGILLADEVGLGKTVEALLIVAQFWAKYRRRILLLVPASLRTQWKEEIEDKFAVPARIADRKMLGVLSAREPDAVVISTPQSVYNQIQSIRRIPWDLLVVDEAHRLRNVYQGGKIATALREAFEAVPKILLSATPIQNNIDELFGLMTFIDPNLFGGLDAFRYRYAGGENATELKARLDPYLARTLRRQVREYIRFTERHCIVHDFHSSPEECKLYDEVSTFLQRSRIPALRLTGRTGGLAFFVQLVYWRLLASSTAAIASALTRLETRLERVVETGEWPDASPVGDDSEAFADALEEAENEETDREEFTREELEADLTWVRSMAQLARDTATSAKQTKARCLADALRKFFSEAESKGYPQKAVIFTEFISTQEFLSEYLEEAGFAEDITLFNGRLRDAAQRRERIEEFRTRTRILISTEAGAEGLNLQFCNIVVNYDLPWNPQRIEQRIGRCHRYGQEHDVIVCNFVNLENEAEKRLHELLQQKLRLFDGVLGASDEILGALESGIDFERRILEILQRCRSPEEIRQEFAELQSEFEEVVQERVQHARNEVLDTFDEDVIRRLRSLESMADSVRAGQADLQVLLHHALPPDSLRPATLPQHPQLQVYTLGVADDLSPLTSPPRLVTFERVARDVAPSVERVNLAHPIITRVLDGQRKSSATWARVELERPSAPRVALLDELVNRGARSGAWFLFRTTAQGFETVDHLWHVVAIDGEVEVLGGEAAERFARAPIRGAWSRSPFPIPDSVRSEADRARSAFEQKLNELYGNLYFQRREELDLRIFDEEERVQEMIDDLRAQLLVVRRKAHQATDFSERESLFDEADRLEKQMIRARRNQNEFLEKLERQKGQELATLRNFRNLDLSSPVLVAACQWTIVC